MPRSEYTWNEQRNCWEKNVRRADGKYTKLRTYGRGSLPELKRMIRDFENQQEQQAHLSQIVTVERVAWQWFAVAAEGLAHNGAEALRNSIQNHVIPLLGSMEISAVLPADIDRLLQSMAGRSLSLRSKVLSAARRIFDYAVENRLALKNPCAGKKSGGKSAKPVNALSPEQQRILVDAVRGTRVYLFVLLALYAGLRREEILGLAWDDVHLEGDYDYIEVTHAVHFEGQRGVRSDDLKTSAARRRIPIPPVLSDALRSAEKTDPLVVPAASGGVCSKQAFKNLWKLVQDRSREPDEPPQRVIVKSNGVRHTSPTVRTITFPVHPHQLRHTYISELCAHSAETGLDLKTIQHLAGHSDPAITMRIYAHVVGDRHADTANKLGKIFADR